MKKEFATAKVHFIAGKGGVGKTLVCQALAKAFAKEFKTLLVELSEEETGEDHPRISSIKKNVSENLSYIKIYPDQSLYEYLRLKIPTKKILDSLLSQSLFRALCSAMPGLSDLTRLGKIWFHADKKHVSHQEIFEKIVVDMPSSGFVGRFLSVARVVQKAVKVGPLAKEAELIHEYFQDPKNARLHLVALAQDLVVNETIELAQKIENAKGVHLGVLFINRVLELKSKDLLNLPPDLESPCPNIKKILRSYQSRLQEERYQRERFKKQGLSLPEIIFPDQMGEMVESRIVDSMVKELLGGFVQ